MTRTVLARVALLALGVAVALVSVEVALRLRAPRMIGAYQGLYVPVEDLGYTMVPHLDVTYATAAYTTRVRANALGFRDAEPALARAEDTFRIVVLGDSLVEALQVPLEATFHKRLQAALSARMPHGRSEVLSMAVGGYGLLQEYAVWWHHARRYRPQLVLLVVCPNDIEASLDGLAAPLSYAKLRDSPQFAAAQQLRLGGLEVSAGQRLLRSFHTYYWIRNTLQRSAGGQAVWHWVRRAAEPSSRGHAAAAVGTDLAGPWFLLAGAGTVPPAQQRWWDAAVDVIEALRDEVSASGAALLVAIAPHGDQLDAQQFAVRMRNAGFGADGVDAARPDRLLAQALAARGVECIELLPALRRAPQPVYVDSGWHWNAEGHRAVAAALLAHLDGLGLPGRVP